jgi:hypothetical protein
VLARSQYPALLSYSDFLGGLQFLAMQNMARRLPEPRPLRKVNLLSPKWLERPAVSGNQERV